MNLDKSKELYSKALTLMPGGVNSPVRAFKSVGGNPIFMKRGNGSRLFDADDNSYIDFCMSWGPMILGHADRAVVDAVISAAENGTSFGTPNPHEVEIASMICERFKSIEKIRFVNSGTEAVMSAVRLARGFTGRDKIVKFDGCYHGHADQMLVAAGSGLATFGAPDSAGVTKGTAADTLVAPFNDLKYLENLFLSQGTSIAAIIVEPLPCNYAMIPPAKGFLEGLRALCDKHGTLLIFDEVITGLRLASGGAQEFYGVMADITTLGKIIGGGLPVGAYGGRADIMAMIAPDGPVYQAGTLSGNPLAMAAGIATLKRIDELGAYALLEERGKFLDSSMNPLCEKYKGKFLYLRTGSIFCVYFSAKEKINSLADVKGGDMKLFAEFHRGMLERGIYLSPSGYEVGFISTAHTEDDLANAASATKNVLGEILA